MKFFNNSSIYYKKTSLALFISAILKEPLFCMYSLTAFILRKDLHATAFHLAILTMIRPTISFLSYYWSSNIQSRQDKLKPNFLWATFLSCLLFLFIPFFNGIWFLILANASYIMFQRAAMPAWMETVKLNIESEKREKLFSYSAALGYLVGAVLAFGIGTFLGKNANMYQSFYFFAALFALANVWVLSEVPVNHQNSNVVTEEKKTIKEKLFDPIKDSIHLMKTREDFALFQWGYMLCGFGLMLIQPIIPIICVDKLHLSHAEFAVALLVFKSLGFVISAPMWGRALSKISIMKLSSFAFFNTFIFIILLIVSYYNSMFIYLAFFIYGITSSGSHLLWNLSGPIFSKEENSSKYTSVNVAMVAIRGSVAPPLGSFLGIFLSPIYILVIGSLFCFYSGFKLLKNKFVLLNVNKKN